MGHDTFVHNNKRWMITFATMNNRKFKLFWRGGGGHKKKRKVLSIVFLASITVCSMFSNWSHLFLDGEIEILMVKLPSVAKKGVFDPHQNPIWPLDPPTLSNSCQVQFRLPELSLCHIIPWKNFGDELGPPVVKRILELHFGCSTDHLRVFELSKIYRGGGDMGFLNRTGSQLQQCLMTVGSLWRMVKSNDHIWGTGVAYNGTVHSRCQPTRHQKNHLVEHVFMYSSRGPLSAQQIQDFCDFEMGNHGDSGSSTNVIPTAGDAGFLVPFLFPELRRQPIDSSDDASRNRLCFIPHKQDKNAIRVHPGLNLLSVDIGWVNMAIRLQQECDVVVSSSLHGVIFSEAYGIPNQRMRISGKPGDFKFSDFYFSYRGREPKSLLVTDSIDGTTIIGNPPLSYADRDRYAKKVLKSFPLHLFHAVHATATTHNKEG